MHLMDEKYLRILFIYYSLWFTISSPKFEKIKSLKTSVTVSRFCQSIE